MMIVARHSAPGCRHSCQNENFAGIRVNLHVALVPLLRCVVAPLRETFFLPPYPTDWLFALGNNFFYSRKGATTQR